GYYHPLPTTLLSSTGRSDIITRCPTQSRRESESKESRKRRVKTLWDKVVCCLFYIPCFAWNIYERFKQR
ncbi:unnamed protein product, partial [Prunus brigantina]